MHIITKVRATPVASPKPCPWQKLAMSGGWGWPSRAHAEGRSSARWLRPA